MGPGSALAIPRLSGTTWNEFNCQTAKTHARIPATRIAPELLYEPPSIKRAQGKPGARCTRSLACEIRKHTSVVTTGSPELPGLPCAMVLTAYFVLSPVTGLYCHRRLADRHPRNLTPASGGQDHTTLPYADSAARLAPLPRPSHPAPRP